MIQEGYPEPRSPHDAEGPVSERPEGQMAGEIAKYDECSKLHRE